jgi:hypothetical protein
VANRLGPAAIATLLRRARAERVAASGRSGVAGLRRVQEHRAVSSSRLNLSYNAILVDGVFAPGQAGSAQVELRFQGGQRAAADAGDLPVFELRFQNAAARLK